MSTCRFSTPPSDNIMDRKENYTGNSSKPPKTGASVMEVDPITAGSIPVQTPPKTPVPAARSRKGIVLRMKTSNARVEKAKTPQPPMPRTKTYMGTVDGVRYVLLGPRHVAAVERRTRLRLTTPRPPQPEMSAAERLELRITGKSRKQPDP